MHHHHTGANNACEIHFHDLLSPSKQLLVTGLTKSMHLYRTAQHTGQCPYWLKDIAKDTNMLKCKKQRQEHTKFRTRKLQQKRRKYEIVVLQERVSADEFCSVFMRYSCRQLNPEPVPVAGVHQRLLDDCRLLSRNRHGLFSRGVS